MDVLKKSFSLLVSLLLVPIPLSLASDNHDTVTICRVDQNDPRNESTVQVSNDGVRGYLQQGSFVGDCSSSNETGTSQICFVPANDPASSATMTRGNKELDGFLLYGCFLGPCSTGDDSHKITICHIPPGNPANAHTIDIDRSALPAHFSHGDYVGPCDPVDNDPCASDSSYQICHNPSDGNGGTTLIIKACRLKSYLKQGDYIGACTPNPTPAPAPATPVPATPTPTVFVEGNHTLCHVPPGAPNHAYEIIVNDLSLASYLLHGDYLGHCNQTNYVCGNGITEGGEQCDTHGESATCNTDCTRSVCGDRITNPFAGELCDAGATLNNTYCLTNCQWARCGDGYVRVGIEECDTKGFSATCNKDCTFSRCGDGTLNTKAGEQCDDGNTLNGDGCSSTCQLETVCGNGVKEGVEECDMGADNGFNAFCLPNCRLATCGDGHTLTGFEQCDDGNQDNTDGCLNNCRLPSCGDSIIEIGVEQCDKGLSNNTGYCLNNCRLNTCGDGYIRTDMEECDLGHFNNNSNFCTESCKRNRCGDGFLYDGVEECDTGFLGWTSSCLPDCRLATCGDGHVQTGVEVCDQGAYNGNGAGFCKQDCSGIQGPYWPTSKIIAVALGSFFGTVAVVTISILAWQYSVLENAAHWYVKDKVMKLDGV